MLGARLDDRYRLDTELRRDSAGVVYAGRDERLNRPVAVTVLAGPRAAEPAYLDACRDRISRLASLTHPHLVPLYDSSLDGETPFIVAPLIEGRNLRERLDQSGPLRPDEARRLAAQASSALAALHDKGLVHGGLGPEQFVMGDDGSLYLADLARPPAEDSDARAPYEAPELALGQTADARSDVFALCAVLYEALCGEPPFTGADRSAIALAKLNRVPDAPADRVPGVGRELSDGLLLGLSSNAALRPADGARLALRLETSSTPGLEATQAMDTTRVMASPPPPPPQTWQAETEPPAPAESSGGFLPWLGLLAVIAVVGVLWLALRHPDQELPPPAQVTLVPSVVGQAEKDALAALREAGLQATVAERQNSDTVPGGQVISQDPAAGTEAPDAKLVKLTVSTGPRFVSVPQMVGMSESEARKMLPKYGLSASISSVHDTEKPHGQVVAQDPPAGQQVDKGRAVTLYVNQLSETEQTGDAPADGPVAGPDAGTPSGPLDQAAEELKDKAKEKAGELIDQAAEDLKQGASEQWDKTKEAARQKVKEKREEVVEGIKDKITGGGDQPPEQP